MTVRTFRVPRIPAGRGRPAVTDTGAVFTVTDELVARWRRTRSIVFLVLLSIAMLQDEPWRPPVLAGMAVAAAAWVAMTFRFGGARIQPYSLAVCAAAGLWLCVADDHGLAPCYLIAAVTIASATLPPVAAAVFTGVSAAALAVTLLLSGTSPTAMATWSGGLLIVLLLGMVRRQRDEHGEQQRQLATLAERARLAREIHDVLAHSLSALSVQLETAAALLEKDRPADAAVIVERAGRLARDGLTETRRAVSALRGDPLPLPELVTELVAGYGAEASVRVDGAPRPLSPETGLALFRTAQEALTNVRKHAPGSLVAVHLEYRPGDVRLAVASSGPAGPPSTGLSSGYGLAGLRERAELAGGTVAAGPDGTGWLVDVRMPG